MKEIVKQTLVFWQNYWGEGYFQYLLLAAVLYLLIFRRKNKKTGYNPGTVSGAREKNHRRKAERG